MLFALPCLVAVQHQAGEPQWDQSTAEAETLEDLQLLRGAWDHQRGRCCWTGLSASFVWWCHHWYYLLNHAFIPSLPPPPPSLTPTHLSSLPPSPPHFHHSFSSFITLSLSLPLDLFLPHCFSSNLFSLPNFLHSNTAVMSHWKLLVDTCGQLWLLQCKLKMIVFQIVLLLQCFSQGHFSNAERG